jgi:hypothetical protein
MPGTLPGGGNPAQGIVEGSMRYLERLGSNLRPALEAIIIDAQLKFPLVRQWLFCEADLLSRHWPSQQLP